MSAVGTLRGPGHTDSLRHSGTVTLPSLGDHLRVQVRKAGGQFAAFAGPDLAPVHLHDRRYAAEGARHERLVRPVHVGEGEGPLEDGYGRDTAEVYDHVPGDAVQGVVACRDPHLPAPHDEEICGVAGRRGSRGIQHQRLVGAGLEGLHEGEHLVHLAVAVELLVQCVGRRATHRRGEEPEALLSHTGVCHLVLGNDDDVGTADHQTQVLRGGLLVPAREHQAHVYAGGAFHAVTADGLAQGFYDLLVRHADVEVYRLCALEEAIEVQVQEGEVASMQANALPHPVPDQKTGVEDGDLRFFPPVELAVDVDQDDLVALVRQCLMSPPGQPPSLHATPRALCGPRAKL